MTVPGPITLRVSEKRTASEPPSARAGTSNIAVSAARKAVARATRRRTACPDRSARSVQVVLMPSRHVSTPKHAVPMGRTAHLCLRVSPSAEPRVAVACTSSRRLRKGRLSRRPTGVSKRRPVTRHRQSGREGGLRYGRQARVERDADTRASDNVRAVAVSGRCASSAVSDRSDSRSRSWTAFCPCTARRSSAGTRREPEHRVQLDPVPRRPNRVRHVDEADADDGRCAGGLPQRRCVDVRRLQGKGRASCERGMSASR